MGTGRVVGSVFLFVGRLDCMQNEAPLPSSHSESRSFLSFSLRYERKSDMIEVKVSCEKVISVFSIFTFLIEIFRFVGNPVRSPLWKIGLLCRPSSSRRRVPHLEEVAK